MYPSIIIGLEVVDCDLNRAYGVVEEGQRGSPNRWSALLIFPDL